MTKLSQFEQFSEQYFGTLGTPWSEDKRKPVTNYSTSSQLLLYFAQLEKKSRKNFYNKKE